MLIKSTIDFIPIKYNTLKEQQEKKNKQLYVGLDPIDFGFVQTNQIQKKINKTYQRRYIEEFPANYLEELPLIQTQKQNIKQKKQYIILRQFGEEEIKKNNLQLPSIDNLNKLELLQIKQPKFNLNLQQDKINLIQQSFKKISAKDFNFYSQFKIQYKYLQKVQRKIKILLIILSFYKLTLQTIEFQIQQNKQKNIENFKENGQSAMKQLSNWINVSLNDFLSQLISVNEKLQIRIVDDELNKNKKKIIQSLLINLMKDMHKIQIEQYFCKQLALILNQVIQSYQFPPNKFYSLFEIKRIKPTQHGSIGQINQKQQKMILMIFLFVRHIIFTQILRCWKFHPNQKNNEEQLLLIQSNSIVIASIIHEIIINWIERNIKKNRLIDIAQLKILFDYLDKPLALNKEIQQKQGKYYEENTLVDGLISRDLLEKYFYKENGQLEEWVTKIEMDILVLIDRILVLLNQDFIEQKLFKDRISKMMVNYYISNQRNKHQ